MSKLTAPRVRQCRSQETTEGGQSAWGGKEEALALTLGNEPRRRSDHTSNLLRGTEDQQIFGPRDPDKTDTPFLLDICARAGGWQDAFGSPHDEHHATLATFGFV